MANPVATVHLVSFATAADMNGMSFDPGDLVYLEDQQCFMYWTGPPGTTMVWHPKPPETTE
jgi:hypothetical protein